MRWTSDHWDTVFAVIETGLRLCATPADIDAFLVENKHTVNALGMARPDLWESLGQRVRDRRRTVARSA